MKIPKLVFAFFLFIPFQSFPNFIHKIGMDRANEILNFLDTPADQFLSNIGEMEKKGLKSAQIEIAPWEGYFWPVWKGLLSYRYADDSLGKNGTWEYYLTKFNEKSAQDYINSGNINKLSPAEKYDLLLGDANFSLTKKMWSFGNAEMAKYSQINIWAGISNGLALASLNLPNPIHPVKLWTVDKKYLITFSQDDIKAIGSMFWSLGAENVRALGARCKEETPQAENNGRPINHECFDINPAKFHIALINQIGIAQKSFVMDRDYNQPVWHFPVIGYRLEYFNLKKPRYEENFGSAMVELKKFEKDPYARFRNEKAEFLIGVRAHVLTSSYKNPATYTGIETKPKIFDYEYDLELDKNLNIVGGEWYSQLRPDFIWQPAKGFSPVTEFEDDILIEWDAQREFFPADWTETAINAANNGIIISPIVKNLFWLSSRGKNGFKTN